MSPGGDTIFQVTFPGWIGGVLTFALSVTACGSTPSRNVGPSALPSPPASVPFVPLPTVAVSPEPPVTPAAPQVEAATVTRVVDGDTIWARLSRGRTEKIRFIGMDTPESTNRVEPYGKEASAYARKLLNGATVFLEFDVDLRDRYGRLLAYIWLRRPVRADAADVRANMANAILVRDGYAQVATYPPNVRYVDDFLALQREARAANRGLWAG